MQSTDQLIRSELRDYYREMNIARFPVSQVDSIKSLSASLVSKLALQ